MSVIVRYYRFQVSSEKRFPNLKGAKRWLREQIDNHFEFYSPYEVEQSGKVIWSQGCKTMKYLESIQEFAREDGPMMASHTPGPWKSGMRNVNELQLSFPGVFIGDVFIDLPTPAGALDSRLIAAAPELLEALKEVLASAHPTPNEHKGMYAAWEKAKLAIAKAEGRES